MKYLGLSAVLFSFATSAQAQWQYEPPSEGNAYAWTSDGGFVDDSYQNGMMFICPPPEAEGLFCRLIVTINGQRPRPPAAVTFEFPDGEKLQRITERVGGGTPQVGWDPRLIEKLRSQSNVTVSFGDHPGHTFSLGGSSQAIGRAMGDID